MVIWKGDFIMAQKNELDILEKQLTALLSNDKQTELQIDSLEELLKDSE